MACQNQAMQVLDSVNKGKMTRAFLALALRAAFGRPNGSCLFVALLPLCHGINARMQFF
jgi:hypothetical protein